MLEVHRAIAHARGRGDGRQGRGECCDDDAQRDLNNPILQLHSRSFLSFSFLSGLGGDGGAWVPPLARLGVRD